MTIAEKVVELLKSKRYHITVAESCTGGALAAEIVGVAGASNVFDVGFVTYSEQSKVALLEVSESTISKHGIVSEQVAMEMACGATRRCGAEVGVGITGWASEPDGGNALQAGLVCFGFCVEGFCSTVKVRFQGKRQQVIKEATTFAIKALHNILK